MHDAFSQITKNMHAMFFQLTSLTKMPIPQDEPLNTVEAMSTEYEYEYYDEGIPKQNYIQTSSDMLKNSSLDIPDFHPSYSLSCFSHQ